MNIETILSRPSIRGLEFRLGIEAYAHKAASALGLTRVTVIWSHGITTAGINQGGELHLASVPDDSVVSRALVLKYAGFVVHELLHHAYTDFAYAQNAHSQYLRVLHNAVEDGWIENKAITEGLLGNVGPLLGEMIDTMTAKAIDEVIDWNDPRQYPYILAVHCRTHAKVKCPTNPRLLPIFDEAAKRCLSAKSSADTFAIAEWVYDQLKQAKDEQKKPEKRKGKDTKDGNGPPSDQNGPTSPDQGEDKGKGADSPQDAPDAPLGDATQSSAKEVEPSLGDKHSWNAATFCKGDIKRGDYHLSGGHCEHLTNAPIPAKLRYEVKRLFDNSGLTEFTRNRKAGVVNVHALPSVATGNERVFKRRLDVEGVDSAVVICLDVSGSMFAERGRGKLILPAVLTCRALLETLSASGVSTAIITFGNDIAVMKPFETNHRTSSLLLGKISPGGGTNDYSALRYAHELLAKRPENRKIAFVLTDGRGRPDETKAQDATGRNMGITTIGIGIRSDVSDIYAQSIEVDDVADLGNASFKQIKLAA
jgi:cobalamin biosynthesis protein CobT